MNEVFSASLDMSSLAGRRDRFGNVVTSQIAPVLSAGSVDRTFLETSAKPSLQSNVVAFVDTSRDS